MITAIGLETDPTMRHFRESAAGKGVEIRFVDLQRQIAEPLEIPPAGPSAAVLDFHPTESFYCRLIDLAPVNPAQSVAWRSLLCGMMGWLELFPGRVVNRPGHAVDNACKPLHEALLARMGFSIPPSVSSSRRDILLDFLAGSPAVAKPLSGQRADCRIVSGEDFEDYDDRSSPVHLQRLVRGDDVRAHVIGGTVVALRIHSDQADYRTDGDAASEPCILPEGLCEALCRATRGMGLEFAGWDLRIDQETYWVFEANPMPGYHYYDRKLKGRITEELVHYLKRKGN